jgi:hypothetical protein
MEEDATNRGPSGGWQLRWGHIGLAILVIGVLIVAWTVYRGSTANQVNVSSNCSGAVINGKCVPANSKPKSSSKVSTPSSSTSTKTNPSTTTAPKSSVATTNSGSSKALSNTGPGNTIGLFIFTAIIGFIAHQLYLRRRLSKEYSN